MRPIEALEQIAFLLEFKNEPGYRVRAFRRAATAIRGRSDEELTEMAAAGSLQGLPNVGDVTAKVIVEALAGGKPAYLEKLEQEREEGIGGAVAALREALLGDCHVHSDWSDGGNPIEEMAAMARDLGHQYMVLTDHSPRLKVANGLTAERLLQQLDVVERLNTEMAPFRILTGIEVDILEDGSLDQEPQLLDRLDVVVASVHSALRQEAEGMTRRMITAIRDPNMDILGHCTGRLLVGRGRPQSTFDAELVFAACAHFDKAVEINSRPERLDPPDDLLALASDLECRFAIDSDSHAPGQLGWLRYGCEKAAATGIGPERIVNTLPADELIAWARTH